MIKPRLQFGHTNKLRAGFNAYLKRLAPLIANMYLPVISV